MCKKKIVYFSIICRLFYIYIYIIYLHIIGIAIKKIKKKIAYLNIKKTDYYTVYFFEKKKVYKFKKKFFKNSIITKFMCEELNKNNFYYFSFLNKKVHFEEIQKILNTFFFKKNDYLTEYLYIN
jgi:hypothetical protein